MGHRNPAYRRDSAGNAYTRINGKRHSLGKYNSEESKRRYLAIIDEYDASGRSRTFGCTIPNLSMAELMVDYLEFHSEMASLNPRSEASRLRNPIKLLADRYADYKVADFKRQQLEGFREMLSKRGLSKFNINAEVSRVKRMFKWGAARGYFPIEAYTNLKAVTPLKTGDPVCKVPPISDEIVFATIQHCSPVIADMVMLQLLAGCRPGEILGLRPKDIQTEGEFWEARLSHHKTAHRKKERTLFFGPDCQPILKKYMDRAPSEYLFRPCDSERQRRALIARITPTNSGNSKGNSKRIREGRVPVRQPGLRYDTQRYGRAIKYACAKAFPIPKNATELEARAWKKEYWWSPNRLRHNAATLMQQEHGAEAAANLLGHSRLDTVQIYAERTYKSALEAAKKYQHMQELRLATNDSIPSGSA